MSAIKVNGSWLRIAEIYVRLDSAWVKHQAIYARTDGVWHLIDLTADPQAPAYNTWVLYADNPYFEFEPVIDVKVPDEVGLSDSPDNKLYVGFKYNQSETQPLTASLYDLSGWIWALKKGNFTWVAFADDDAGANISADDLEQPYIGFAYDQSNADFEVTDEAFDASVFVWVLRNTEIDENFDPRQQITDTLNSIFDNFERGEDVQTETKIRVTETKKLTAEVDNAKASIETTNQVIAEKDLAIATEITEIKASVNDNESSITTAQQAISNEVSARASSVSLLNSRVGTNESDVFWLGEAISDESSTRATQISGVNSGLASANLQLTTHANSLGELNARAFFGIDLNGRVSGVHVNGNNVASSIEFVADSVSFVDTDGIAQLYWDGGANTLKFTGDISGAKGTFTGRVRVRSEQSLTAGDFECSSPGGYGVAAVNNSGSGVTAIGAVSGVLSRGVTFGVHSQASHLSGIGVQGFATNTFGTGGDFQGGKTGVFGACSNITGRGVVGYGGGKDFYASNSGYFPFTGGHEGLIDINHPALNVGDIICDQALISIQNVSNAICLMRVSVTPYQKAARGIYVHHHALTSTDVAGLDNELETTQLALIYDLVSFNSVGEGAMNVCGENGDLEIGDLIVTSSMAGKGMKQNNDILRSYTVAESRQNVVFESPDEVKQIAVIYRCG